MGVPHIETPGGGPMGDPRAGVAGVGWGANEKASNVEGYISCGGGGWWGGGRCGWRVGGSEHVGMAPPRGALAKSSGRGASASALPVGRWAGASSANVTIFVADKRQAPSKTKMKSDAKACSFLMFFFV